MNENTTLQPQKMTREEDEEQSTQWKNIRIWLDEQRASRKSCATVQGGKTGGVERKAAIHDGQTGGSKTKSGTARGRNQKTGNKECDS